MLKNNFMHLTRGVISRWSSEGQRCISTANGPLQLQLTSVLGAEPLKKKKRLDPTLTKARDDKKKRRIEKAIRKLERNEGQLKPIDEAEVSLKLRNEMRLRYRRNEPLPESEVDSRRSIELQWSRYKYQQHLQEAVMINTAQAAQERALAELRRVSEQLWSEAIQVDQFVFPIRFEGPVLSLPIKEYDQPDGDYADVSKNWD